MKKILITLLLSSSILFAQKKEPSFNKDNKINKIQSNNSKYTLIMVSGAGCGYCEIALKKLLQLKENNKIKIIIYEFGGEKLITKMYKNSDYFKLFVFINAEKENNKNFNDEFFPIFYLYKNNKLIWREKGYDRKTIYKIEKRIKSH